MAAQLTSDEIRDILKELNDVHATERKIERLREKSAKSVSSTIRSGHKIMKQKSYILRLDGETLRMQKKLDKISKSQKKEDIDEAKRLTVSIKKHKELLEYEKEELKTQKKSISVKSTIYAIGNSTAQLVAKGLQDLVKQDKAVKNTALSMGLANSEMKSMRSNMYKTAQQTSLIGVGVEDLAKMQSVYSDEIGRAVILTEIQLTAMANMAKGTMLGAEGAANLASNMDLFGINAENSSKFIEDIMNDSHSMGVNAYKVTKKMGATLKTAQGYNFKNGVRGIGEMAIRAEKFKLSIDAATNMAEKLINPEGAINMAANLQVLGGKWAQLGDTFTLMYKARHDVNGLHKDIIEATKGTAQWDKELGQAVITGMEMHRLREVAKATGIDYKQLAESSREFAKQSQATKSLKFNISKKNKDFITSLAVWDDNAKDFTVNLGDGKGSQMIKDLSDNSIELIRSQKETLEERAKSAQTFDETWGNIVNSLKSTLLPLLQGIADGIQAPLNKFVTYLQGKDGKEMLTGIAETGEKIGNLVLSLGKFVADNPIKSAISAGAIAIAGKAAQWIYNGKMLSIGFNMGVKGFGGFGGGGAGGTGGAFNRNNISRSGSKNLKSHGYTQNSAKDWMKPGNSSQMASKKELQKHSAYKNGGSSSRMSRGAGVGLGAAAMVGGMGLDIWRDSLDDRDSNAGKAMGIGASALEYGGTGAMIGTMIGGPGIGTAIGAGVGALGGALYGAYNEGYFNDAVNTQMNDAILSKEGITPINKDDDLVAYKPGGPVDNKINGIGTSEITIKPITINGTIKLETDNGFNHNLLEDPIFKRELAKVIGEEITKNTNGGKR